MSSDYQRFMRSDYKYRNRFDELKRQRQQRKRNRVKKYNPGLDVEKKTEMFDSKGTHIKSGLDLCDCLVEECSGCFFKCPNKKCKSYKCGPDCRQKRKYYYESIEDPIVDTKRTNEIVIKYQNSSDIIHIN